MANSHYSEANKSMVASLFGNLATQIFHPLENIKIIYQAVDNAGNNPIIKKKNIFKTMLFLYRSGGFGALYRGVIPTCLATSLSNIVFFYSYGLIRSLIKYEQFPTQNKMITISSISSITAMIITLPFMCIKTRIILYRKNYFEIQGRV